MIRENLFTKLLYSEINKIDIPIDGLIRRKKDGTNCK